MALTIRPNTPEEVKLIEETKKATGNSSASKALMDAARIAVESVPNYKARIGELKEHVQELIAENAVLQDLLVQQKYLKDQLSELDSKIKNAIKTKSGSAARGSSGIDF